MARKCITDASCGPAANQGPLGLIQPLNKSRLALPYADA